MQVCVGVCDTIITTGGMSFRYEVQVSHECAVHALNNLRAATWMSCAQLDTIWGDGRADTIVVRHCDLLQTRLGSGWRASPLSRTSGPMLCLLGSCAPGSRLKPRASRYARGRTARTKHDESRLSSKSKPGHYWTSTASVSRGRLSSDACCMGRMGRLQARIERTPRRRVHHGTTK